MWYVSIRFAEERDVYVAKDGISTTIHLTEAGLWEYPESVHVAREWNAHHHTGYANVEYRGVLLRIIPSI